MIIDWIENADLYMNLNERIAAGLRALQHPETLDQSPGWLKRGVIKLPWSTSDR